MAQRRMFSKKITDTDIFLDMPASAQNLYFHLNMHADDDGFLGNAKTIKRMVGASDDDLKLLAAKQFILTFEDGVTVIRDWRVHNYIQKDRYRSTIYTDHKRELEVNENQQYQRIGTMDTKCIQDVSNMDTQVRLGKDRLEIGKDRDRLGNNNKTDSSSPAKADDHLSESFEAIWKEYPNKAGKKDAFRHYKKWRKESKEHTDEYLMERLAAYKQDLAANQWKKPMNGSTWFNGRFDDEYTTPAQQITNPYDRYYE